MTIRSIRVVPLSLLFAASTFLGLQAPAFAAEHDDAWITSKTKMQLWTTAGVSSLDVYVDTVDGHVVLSGKVETTAERELAEKVTRGIEGVKDVRNLMQIVTQKQEKAIEQSDKDVEARVRKAFSAERTLANTKVVLASVNKGVVLLTGDARTFSEHLMAVETARVVKGVRAVASQVKCPPGLGDEEISEGSASRSGRDMFITTGVKLRLFADRAVQSRDIQVDSRYGVVVLFGTVPTVAAKEAAERDAHKVKGVDRVMNDLQVVAPADRKLVAAKDDVVKISVKQALDAREGMGKVDVAVKNATVRLTGNVSSVSGKLRATLVARGAEGVESVDNDLEVKRK